MQRHNIQQRYHYCPKCHLIYVRTNTKGQGLTSTCGPCAVEHTNYEAKLAKISQYWDLTKVPKQL